MSHFSTEDVLFWNKTLQMGIFAFRCKVMRKSSKSKQTIATMGRIIIKKNSYLPRHHCTTQHLCLFALGLPAPAVIRKDRKTGWQGDRDRAKLKKTQVGDFISTLWDTQHLSLLL